MTDYRRLSGSYRIGLQLGGAAYFVLVNYVPAEAHATVAESPAGQLQGDNSEPEPQVKPAFDMRAVGALGATGIGAAAAMPFGATGQGRVDNSIGSAEPVQTRQMPVALMGQLSRPDEPAQEYPTESAQAARPTAGPQAATLLPWFDGLNSTSPRRRPDPPAWGGGQVFEPPPMMAPATQAQPQIVAGVQGPTLGELRELVAAQLSDGLYRVPTGTIKPA